MKFLKWSALLALIGLSALLPGCGLFNAVYGSGNVTTVDSDLDSFTRVSVENACEARVRHGADFAVTVTLDDNLIPYLRLEKIGDELRVGLAPGHSYVSCTCVADITLPVLSSLSVDDASSAEVSGFTAAANLALTVSNASAPALSEMNADNTAITVGDASSVSGLLDCLDVNLRVSNSSSADLSGAVLGLSLDVANACSAHLAGLNAASVVAQVRNASSAEVRTAGPLSGSVSSASSLRYAGNPSSVAVGTDASSSCRPM